MIKRFLYLTFLALLFLLAARVLQRATFINKISCRSQYGPCNTSLNEALKGAENTDFFSAKNFLTGLLGENYLVEEYSFSFVFPNEVRVDLIENKPLYAIFQDAGFYLIDAQGRLIGESASTELPASSVLEKKYELGEVVSREVLFGLELTRKLNSSYKVSSALIKNTNLEVAFSDLPDAIFPLTGEQEVLSGALKVIIMRLNNLGEEFRIDGKKVTLIDLRFKNPVLR